MRELQYVVPGVPDVPLTFSSWLEGWMMQRISACSSQYQEQSTPTRDQCRPEPHTPPVDDA